MGKDSWQEIPDRHVHKSGNVYGGKEFTEDYEIRVFVMRNRKRYNDVVT